MVGGKVTAGVSGKGVASPGSKLRAPEDIFCVLKTPKGGLQRPESSLSLDTLGHRRRDSNNSACSSVPGDTSDAGWLPGSTEQGLHDSPNGSTEKLQPTRRQGKGSTENLLTPGQWTMRTKATLVKSNSDSSYRLSPASTTPGMVKASSDDACFARRTPKSEKQRSRARNAAGSAVQTPTGTGTPHAASATSLSGVALDGLSVGSGEGGVMGGAASASAVLDWLFVGSVEAAFNEPLLCALGVDAVVDLTNVPPHLVPVEKKTTCPCSCATKHFRAKLSLAIDDIDWENIEQYFPDVNSFLNGWRQKGRKVSSHFCLSNVVL